MTGLRSLTPRFFLPVLVALAFLNVSEVTAQEISDLPDHVIERFGTPPPIPEGPISPELDAALRTAFIDVFETRRWTSDQGAALEQIVQAGDPRVAWVITDMMRFAFNMPFDLDLAVATSRLLGVELRSLSHWGEMTDYLIAWDVPAFPGYLEFKRSIFTSFVPGWEDLMVEGDIDWRLVSWGGVLIDARPFDTTDDPCNCIPAADNPEVVSAAMPPGRPMTTSSSASK